MKPDTREVDEPIDLGPKVPRGRRVHAEGCTGRLKVQWSGMSCDCGGRREGY